MWKDISVAFRLCNSKSFPADNEKILTYTGHKSGILSKKCCVLYRLIILWVRSTYFGLHVIKDLKDGAKNFSYHSYIPNGARMVLYYVVVITIILSNSQHFECM